MLRMLWRNAYNGSYYAPRAVLAAYGLALDTPEPEIVAHLFKLYAEKT